MLTTALVAYARANGLAAADPAFESKPVRWAIQLSPDGRYLGLLDLATSTSRQGKGLQVPKKIGANAGGVASIGVDTARFVLGLADSAENAAKAQRDHPAFVALHQEAAQRFPSDQGLTAAAAFLASPEQLERARADAIASKVKENDRVALSLPSAQDPFIVGHPAAVEFWREKFASAKTERQSGAVRLCLACGQLAEAVLTNDAKVMGLGALGGQPSGTALVSFDKDAFQSYGWDKNLNAAICDACTFAYTRALNRLLDPRNSPRTRIDLAGTAFLTWTDGAGQPLVGFFDEPDPEQVERLLTAVFSGDRPPAPEELAHLYVLGIRGNGGRVVVTDWIDVTIAEYHRNIARWFADLQIRLDRDQKRGGQTIRQQGELALPPGLRTLAEATARDRDSIPRRAPVHLLRAALRGEPLPLSIAQACIRRFHAEGFGSYLTPVRIALIRCTLNRITPKGGTTIMPGLDPNNTDPAYLCGRLLAVLESAQYYGAGNVGASIVDRYYGRASTAPSLVFGQLMSLAQAHLHAINNEGTRIAISQRIADIVGKLDSQFPTRLTLEEQGRFAIGYYHERAHAFAQARSRGEQPPAETAPAG